MAWKATIAGVDVTNHIQTAQPVTITQLLNERATAQFRCKPGISPNRFDPVVLYADDGVTPLFGGLVTNRTIVGIQTKDRKEPYSTDVQCGDYFTYLDWAYLNLTYTAPVTLKQVLTDLVAAIPSSSGITLNPAQTSPATPLQGFAWTQMRASDAIRDLSQRTGYVATMSPAKVLTMFAPGSTPAPYTITDAAPHCQTIVWTDNSYVPANDAIAVCGPSGPLVTTQYWTVAAPSTWPVDIQCVIGGWNQGYVSENGTVNRTVSAPGGGGYYIFDPTAGRGTLSLGSGTKAAAGTVLAFVYTAVYPFTVHATTGATPVIQFQQTYPTIVDYSQGQETANGLLAQLNQQPRDLTVTSLDTGWAPGQALTVNLTARLTSSFVLTSVTLTLSPRKGPTTHWLTSFVATESQTYQGSYLDQWRALTGTSSVSGGSVSTPPVGGSGGGSGGGTGGGVSGGGTIGRLAKWQSAVALTDSVVTEAAGYIGIGTTTPVAPLEVVGRFRLTGAPPVAPTSGVGFELSYDSTNAIGKLITYDRSGGAYKPMNVEGNPLGLNVQSLSNVGIGTASPACKLDIAGLARTAAAPFVAPTSGRGLEVVYDSGSDAGVIASYDRTGAAYKRINLAGSPIGLNTGGQGLVGIGTPTPAAPLDLEVTDAGVGTKTLAAIIGRSGAAAGATERMVGLAFQDANNPTLVGGIAGTRLNSGAFWYGGLAFFIHALNAPASTFANLAEAMRIDYVGGVLPGNDTVNGTIPGSLGNFFTRWPTIWAAELHVESLVAQQTIVTIGGRALIASGANLLTAPSAATDGSIWVKYNDFTLGCVIVFEGLDATGAYSTEYMQVITNPAGSGPFNYSVTRNYGGSTTAHAWPVGAACMNTGVAGAGFIDMYALNSLKGPSEVGPTIVGNVRNSAAYNDWSPRWAIGNLTGTPYGINQYGAAFGVPGRTRLTFDPVGGILMYDGANNLRVQIAPNGTASFNGDGSGVTSINGGNIATGTITAAQITARSITADRMAFNTLTATEIAAGTITATQIAAGTITATQIASRTIVAGNMNVSQLSAIAADLGSITAGSINAVTISGSTITGTTINGSTIHAGSGNEVTLDGSGITVAGGTGANNRYKFTSGSYIQGQQPGSADLVLYGAQNLVMSTGNGLGLALGSGALYPYNSGPVSLGTGGSPWVDVFATGTVTANALHQTTWPAGSNLAVHVLANGFLVANPSSLRYKEQVRPWDATLRRARAILSAQPILFDYLGPPLGSGQKDLLGFSAEDLYAIDPHLAALDEAGLPLGIHHDALFAHLLVALQDVTRRVATLEGQS